MARVPSAENVGKVSAIGNSQTPSIPRNAFGQETSAALENFAQFSGRVVGEFREARIQSQYSSAIAKSSTELKLLEAEFRERRKNADPDNPPDPDAEQKAYEARAEAIRQKYSAPLSGHQAFDAFNSEFDRFQALGGINVRREARETFVVFAQSALNSGLFQFARLAAQARTEPERRNVIDQGEAAIDGAVRTGVIAAATAVELKKDFRSKVESEPAMRLLLEDPEAARKRDQKFWNEMFGKTQGE